MKNFGMIALALFVFTGCNPQAPDPAGPGGPYCPCGGFYLQEYIQNRYTLNESNAALLVQYYSRVSSGDWESLSDLGFGSEDIQALQRGEMPSEMAVTALAARLGMNADEASEVLRKVRADIQN